MRFTFARSTEVRFFIGAEIVETGLLKRKRAKRELELEVSVQQATVLSSREKTHSDFAISSGFLQNFRFNAMTKNFAKVAKEIHKYEYLISRRIQKNFLHTQKDSKTME